MSKEEIKQAVHELIEQEPGSADFGEPGRPGDLYWRLLDGPPEDYTRRSYQEIFQELCSRAEDLVDAPLDVDDESNVRAAADSIWSELHDE